MISVPNTAKTPNQNRRGQLFALVPRSLLMFVVTGVSYFFQHIPVLNIILLFMLAPLWSVLLINAGFLGIIGEVLTKRVHYAWLVLPIGYFGGYYTWYAQDQAALRRLGEEFRDANAKVHIAFDPNKQALVYNGSDGGGWFVENYNLPVVYQQSGSTGSQYRSTRMIARPVCDQLRDDKTLSGASIYTFGFHDAVEGKIGGKFETRFCTLTMPDKPTMPLFTVDRMEQHSTAMGLPVTIATTTITTPEGKHYVLKGGVASPLQMLPAPLIGCDPFSNKCEANFWRTGFSPIAARGSRFYSDSMTLADALGLKRISPENRKGAEPGNILRRVNAKQEQIVADELRVLDRVIADVSSPADSLPFRSLHGQTALLLPRLNGMIAAIERGVLMESKGRGNAQQLFGLVKQLPRDAVSPYAKRLEAVWIKDSYFEYGASTPIALADMPVRCKTAAQRRMSTQQLTRDLAERRNHPISDAALLDAYHHPECHPADPFGNSVLGVNRNTTVKLGYRNGHVVLFYTPGSRAVLSSTSNTYSDERLQGQSCASIGGTEMQFGPNTICVPPPVAPLMMKDASVVANPDARL